MNYKIVELKDGSFFQNVIEIEERNEIAVIKTGYNRIKKEIEVFSSCIKI